MQALGSNHVVSASGDKTLRLWALDTGTCERVLQVQLVRSHLPPLPTARR